ncbi:MAG: hypothetical protein N3B10_09670 [Armatimonadetes bacterium]|nr:hypothetical protein [Armatimonadota bacterium]MCX7968736.1 hypothetical protein [Armatimonadota bacterium]MDW8143839.1 hypothetical protein [Armatimonadota bacterium]
MASSQAVSRWTAESLLEIVKSLPDNELERFLAKLDEWRASREEEELLRVIKENSQLPPEKQKRFNRLRRKLQSETATEKEHAEYLALLQELEQRNIKRLKALIELARRRGVKVQDLMRELGIGEKVEVI